MRQLKKELTKAFEAPQPQRKEEFLRQHGNGGGSLTGFLMVQLSYIGKGTWGMMALIFIISMLAGRCMYFQDASQALGILGAIMPFWAGLFMSEGLKSKRNGMAELELSCRHSILQVTMARFIILGIVELAALLAVGAGIGNAWRAGFVRGTVYILVPWMATSFLSLCLIKRSGRENEAWYCLGAAVLVSITLMSCGNIWKEMYSPVFFGCWLLLFALLLAGNGYKIKWFRQHMEDYLWNLN